MRNEVYQSFPLHFYLGNNEFQMLNSDISNFFRDSQLSNDHQYGNFLPLSTVEFSQTLTSLQNPVLSDATASAPQPRLIQSTSSAPEAKLIGMKNDRKRSVLLEKNFMIEESKKMKAVCEEDPRPCHPIHDPSSDTQEKEKEKEKKAPVRRSQKIGDKITALQKLVSPFGKTDTASVLQEAAVFIKYLQEQIEVLSAPYFAARPLCHQLVVGRNSADLGSRGLCLVPLSYTQNLTKDDQPEHSISRRTIIPRKH